MNIPLVGQPGASGADLNLLLGHDLYKKLLALINSQLGQAVELYLNHHVQVLNFIRISFVFFFYLNLFIFSRCPARCWTPCEPEKMATQTITWTKCWPWFVNKSSPMAWITSACPMVTCRSACLSGPLEQSAEEFSWPKASWPEWRRSTELETPLSATTAISSTLNRTWASTTLVWATISPSLSWTLDPEALWLEPSLMQISTLR